MGQAWVVIAAAAAFLAVMAFLLALAAVVGRVCATERVAQFLRRETELRERRLSLQDRRTASARGVEASLVSLQTQPPGAPGASAPAAAARSVLDPAVAIGAVKRDPQKAAAVLKNLIQT